MVEEQVLVSICMPVYNGALFIEEAFESILKQSYRNVEVIISDDASSDDTLVRCEAFKERSPFPVSIYKHQQQRIGDNWNYCVQHANGGYIKFLFQDDTLEPTCLELMVNVLNEYQQVGLVACKRKFLIEGDEANKSNQRWLQQFSNLQQELEVTRVYPMRLSKNDLADPVFFSPPRNNKIGEPTAVMLRRTAMEKVGWFNTQLKQALDYEYWYRMMKQFDIILLEQALVSFRLHAQQATQVHLHDGLDEKKQWRKLLFTQFFQFLNPELQDNLRTQFSLRTRLIRKCKRLLGV